jgi:hypothetical protein
MGWSPPGKIIMTSIWCEKTVNDFKVKAEVQTEKTAQRPGDEQISNLNEKKEKA